MNQNKKMFALTRSTTRTTRRLCRHFSFSYPAPRTLDEVVKLDLLKDESPARINEIWQEYHDSKEDVIGASWTTNDYESFLKTGKSASMFVFPVERSDGNFVMLSQVQEKHCILTMLDEYRLNPANAQPWLALTFYDDLAEDKDVVLVRGDVLIPQLTLEEGKRLWGNVRHFYLNETDQVDKFNNDPNEFNIDSHLARNFEELV
jgi:ATP synthase F1 complex assembly factor 1